MMSELPTDSRETSAACSTLDSPEKSIIESFSTLVGAASNELDKKTDSSTKSPESKNCGIKYPRFGEPKK
jgi:hypothetical protein